MSAHTGTDTRAGLPGADQQPPAYLRIGLALLALLLVQQVSGLHWPWLGQLQDNDLYKQLTGFTLLAFSAWQWRFSLLRAAGRLVQAAAVGPAHRLVGATAPVFFYLHSERIGHAYQAALSLTFLAIFVTGLLNREVLGLHRPGFRAMWIAAHVGLATLLPFLLAYHVFITYAYE